MFQRRYEAVGASSARVRVHESGTSFRFRKCQQNPSTFPAVMSSRSRVPRSVRNGPAILQGRSYPPTGERILRAGGTRILEPCVTSHATQDPCEDGVDVRRSAIWICSFVEPGTIDAAAAHDTNRVPGIVLTRNRRWRFCPARCSQIFEDDVDLTRREGIGFLRTKRPCSRSHHAPGAFPAELIAVAHLRARQAENALQIRTTGRQNR